MFILLLILLFLTLHLLWQRRHLYKLSWKLPGPIGYPLLGNGVYFVDTKSIMPELDNVSRKYESPMRLWLGSILTIFITDAESAEVLLKSKDCLNKPDTFYKILSDALSADGVLTLKGEKWKEHRRLVLPAISLAKVQPQMAIFNDNIKTMIKNISNNEDFFDILVPLRACQMTISLETALGGDWELEVKQRYLKQFNEGLEIVTHRVMRPQYQFDFLWNLTKSAYRLREYNQYGRKLFAKVKNDILKNGCNGNSFLEQLLEISSNKPDFTHEDALDETAVVFSSAVDTSSTTTAFLAVMLAMHPEYQEKVYREVLEVMPDKDSDLSCSDIDKLNFTDLCVRETLRIFPTVSIIARIAAKPIRLPSGVEIPPDVPIVFGIRQIHMKEQYYGPTAGIFDPYRFLDKNIKNLPSACYIPFSYGPRNCIGIAYGKISVKSMIAHLVRNYRLTTTYKSMDDIKIEQFVTMQLVHKHMIKLNKRQE